MLTLKKQSKSWKSTRPLNIFALMSRILTIFVDFVKQSRSQWPDKTIMAGDVVTAEMVEELILAGADIIKVGIGPGSVCTTKKKTVFFSII